MGKIKYNKIKKWSKTREEGKWGENGRSREKENSNEGLFYKKNLLSIEEKIERKQKI